MKLGRHMPDGERRKPIDIEVCRSKVKVTLSIHVFATRLSHLTKMYYKLSLKYQRFEIEKNTTLQIQKYKYIVDKIKTNLTCSTFLYS
jgi:hypothetical protein